MPLQRLFVALLSALVFASHAAPLSRVPNGTLTLPANAPSFGYQLVDAFLGVVEPVCIASPPGETNRLFIVERPGRIQVFPNLPSRNSTVFLDITNRVNMGGEGGLLGLAFHPGFSTNRLFYVFYTLTGTSAGGAGFHNRVARFEVSPTNPNLALPNSELVLLNQFDPADNHNGGDLHFGPDGYLYVSLGDGGGGNDPFQNGQRIDKDFFSAILRLDVDKRPGNLPPNPHPAASTNYFVPVDNPFIGATNFAGSPVDPSRVRTEFWAIGLRNPWRMSFDPATGDLYCGDVGQDAREEIDIITRGGNYGWSFREGSIPTFKFPPPFEANFVEPILDYRRIGTTGNPNLEGNSVVGGLISRGRRLDQLAGDYVFGDTMSGHIWALRWDGNSTSNFRRLTSAANPAAFGVDPSNGDILIAEIYNWKVRRLIYDNSPGGPAFPPTLADTRAFAELASLSPAPGVVPYELNVPFWSDHAHKSRWFSIPDTNQFIGFKSNENWSFPTGTVWIKHFELELTNGVPASRRRLETRFLVRDSSDGIYGITYRWGNSLTNATLVPEEGMDEAFLVYEGSTVRTQVWHYPARSECRTCHTRQGGLALGFSTPQLNRPFNYGGTVENQLTALARAGYFTSSIPETASLPMMAHATNTSFSIEHRVRSYLAANCVQCHQPGGPGRGAWDARFSTPLEQAGLINGPLQNDFGNPENKVIRPGSLEHSILFQRIAQWGPGHMPPLATSELNAQAAALLAQWITNDLRPNLPPVAISDEIERALPEGTKVSIATLLANDSDPDGDPVSFVSVEALSANGASLTHDTVWIHYTAPAGFTNDDAFIYTIADDKGLVGSGTVNVKVTSNSGSANLTITPLNNGSYRIRGDGVPGFAYRVEYSSALSPSTWHALGSFTANEVGLFDAFDTPPAGSGQRFYRSVYR